jgi:Arc/MetJ family transcription regulator
MGKVQRLRNDTCTIPLIYFSGKIELVYWMDECHTLGMKLTINIDDALLDRVVAITGASTKTEAITFALREIDRKARLVEVLREGLGASPAELRDMFDEASAPDRFRYPEADSGYGLKVAETPAEYGATKNREAGEKR